MNPYVIYIIVSLLSGLVCFFFAKEKRKNPFLWFFIGFIFSLVGIFIILAIKKKL